MGAGLVSKRDHYDCSAQRAWTISSSTLSVCFFLTFYLSPILSSSIINRPSVANATQFCTLQCHRYMQNRGPTSHRLTCLHSKSRRIAEWVWKEWRERESQVCHQPHHTHGCNDWQSTWDQSLLQVKTKWLKDILNPLQARGQRTQNRKLVEPHSKKVSMLLKNLKWLAILYICSSQHSQNNDYCGSSSSTCTICIILILTRQVFLQTLLFCSVPKCIFIMLFSCFLNKQGPHSLVENWTDYRPCLCWRVMSSCAGLDCASCLLDVVMTGFFCCTRFLMSDWFRRDHRDHCCHGSAV